MSDGAAVPPALPEVEVATGRRRLSLAARTGLLAAGVAALTTVVLSLMAYPIVRQAAVVQAQATLGQQADVVAGVLTDRPDDAISQGRLKQLVKSLEAQGIQGYIVRPGGPFVAPVEPDDIRALSDGRPVSAVRDMPEGDVFLEGRPIERRQGVVLVQRAMVATAQTNALLRRLLVAFLIGLLLSMLIGWLVSRRITRSLRQAAAAAERISAGERDVRLEPSGPEEVADIATSLNRLASALAVSENRQRAFLMSVSHELRTPLTAVKGYGEALADGVIPAGDVARTGEVVASEADRLERLVSDLLDLARAGAVSLRLDLTEVDLEDFADDAAHVWSLRCQREGVEFRLEGPGQPLLVTTDPLRLRQIIDNLAENALRVTPAGSPIVLAVRPSSVGAEVEVRDGGPGLTEDDLAVAFVPEELHSRYRGVRTVGTGLGLALVGSLATRLGGRAEAGHSPEGGARFTVTIPRGGPQPS